MIYILVNPLANNGRGRKEAESFLEREKGDKTFVNVQDLRDYEGFFSALAPEDVIVIAGGDGTLQHFINDMPKGALEHKIYFYPCGSGNDFGHDIDYKKEDGWIKMNSYISDLPIVRFNGLERRFLNNAAMGIDGYVCEKADEHRRKSGRKVNYTSIALKGLLYDYKPCKAWITTEEGTREYEHVWMAPTMKGRFFGGGMMITPMQDRNREDRSLTIAVVHEKNKFRLLSIFPKIFTGGHVGYKDSVTFLTTKHAKVEFEHPVSVQIDGETYLQVKEYEVFA